MLTNSCTSFTREVNMGRKRLPYEIREQIIDIYNSGKTTSEIVRLIGFSRSTVYKVLKRYRAELL